MHANKCQVGSDLDTWFDYDNDAQQQQQQQKQQGFDNTFLETNNVATAYFLRVC